MSHRSRAQSQQGTVLCRMATDHGVAMRFYLLVIVFCVFLPWLLGGLQIPPSGQADSAAPLFKFVETVQKDARGDELTNL